MPQTNYQRMFLQKKLMKEEGKIKDEGSFTVGWKMFKGCFDIIYGQSFHVNVGDEIPSNIDLVDLDSGSKINLNKIGEKDIPLILNFGSCT